MAQLGLVQAARMVQPDTGGTGGGGSDACQQQRFGAAMVDAAADEFITSLRAIKASRTTEIRRSRAAPVSCVGMALHWTRPIRVVG